MMKDKEQTYTFENQSIKYFFQPSKQDRKHLLIVFSGFGSESSVSYDFIGDSSEHCRSNILWIKDEIDKECTYYLCQNNNFYIERIVVSLIDDKIKSIGINKSECTLMGFSKGGSAALYYGLKYDFKNIIASCPQTNIGSYVSKFWPHTAKNMMGKTPSVEEIKHIDNLIPNLLSTDKELNRNIYLITSPNDEQYASEIEPYISYFSKYKNFSFVFTKSSMVWQHSKVTRYNLPIILSIVYAHGEGIYPILGQNINGVDINQDTSRHKIISHQKSTKTLISTVNSISFLEGKLYIKGVAFIRGYECPSYNNIKHTLILKGREHTYRFSLGKVLNKEINYNYFEQTFCDYSAAEFTTIGHKGVDISSIEHDVYKVYIEVECSGTVISSLLNSKKFINSSTLIGTDELYIGTHDDSLVIHRKTLLTKNNFYNFNVTSQWHRDSFLHIEGVFAIQGVDVSNWGDASYYIVLKDTLNSYPFRIGMSDLVNSALLFEDTHDIYKKSYFSTIGRKGIDISQIPNGEYDVFIVMSHHGKLFSQEIYDKVMWNGSNISFLNNITHVGIIGSCVTRDNFNTKFNANYKEKFICSALQNQSSLISIMSPAINISNDSFIDLDQWSAKDTLRDFRKTIWTDLQDEKLDILIFDLFTDARFSCVSIDNSFITLNEWKLEKSDYYKSIHNNNKLGFAIDELSFITKFKESLLLLKEKLSVLCPNVTIILHSARGVYSYSDNGEINQFNSAFVKTLNDRWDKLDRLFIDTFNPIVIDLFNDDSFLGDSAHPWGCSTVHYEKNYYHSFLAKLDHVLLERNPELS